MSSTLHILIIEDHPLIIEGYTGVLGDIVSKNPDLDFNITTANTCDEASLTIERAAENQEIDLVILDISLPISPKSEILSGDDLGVKLKSLFSNVKIIVATHLHNNFRLINILKKVQPDGLLLKNELTAKGLTDAILNVIDGIPFYSNAILRLMRLHITNDFNLDEIDKQMLYHLSLGVKTKDLTEIVHLSQSGVENRKRRLNQIFNNEKKSDKALLKLAKENGFL